MWNITLKNSHVKKSQVALAVVSWDLKGDISMAFLDAHKNFFSSIFPTLWIEIPSIKLKYSMWKVSYFCCAKVTIHWLLLSWIFPLYIFGFKRIIYILLIWNQLIFQVWLDLLEFYFRQILLKMNILWNVNFFVFEFLSIHKPLVPGWKSKRKKMKNGQLVSLNIWIDLWYEHLHELCYHYGILDPFVNECSQQEATNFKVRANVFVPIHNEWIWASYNQPWPMSFHSLMDFKRHDLECLGTPRTPHSNHH